MSTPRDDVPTDEVRERLAPAVVRGLTGIPVHPSMLTTEARETCARIVQHVEPVVTEAITAAAAHAVARALAEQREQIVAAVKALGGSDICTCTKCSVIRRAADIVREVGKP